MSPPAETGAVCPACLPLQALSSQSQPVPHLACSKCANAVLPPEAAHHLLHTRLGIDPQRAEGRLELGPPTALSCPTCISNLRRARVDGAMVAMCSDCGTMWGPMATFNQLVAAAAPPPRAPDPGLRLEQPPMPPPAPRTSSLPLPPPAAAASPPSYRSTLPLPDPPPAAGAAASSPARIDSSAPPVLMVPPVELPPADGPRPPVAEASDHDRPAGLRPGALTPGWSPQPRRPSSGAVVGQRGASRRPRRSTSLRNDSVLVGVGLFTLAMFLAAGFLVWRRSWPEPTYDDATASTALAPEAMAEMEALDPDEPMPVGPLAALPFGGQRVQWWKARLDELAADPKAAATYELTRRRVERMGFVVDGGPDAHRIRPTRRLYRYVADRSRQ